MTMKDPAAVALGKRGGAATAAKHDRNHYSEIGRRGAAERSALMDDGRLYRELAALGLLPGADKIERARRKAAKAGGAA